MPIYTKQGDKGETNLNSSTLKKSHPLLDLIGNIDELNSSLGLLHAIRNKKIRALVEDLQNDLFSLGAKLSGAKIDLNYSSRTNDIEHAIDELSLSLPKLSNFIIPGGSKFAAQLQLSRAVARRTERSAVALMEKGVLKDSEGEGLITYLNRLSDLLFVMARYVNFKLGIKDTIWPKKR